MIRDIFKEDNDTEDSASEDEDDNPSKWSLINSLNYMFSGILGSKKEAK